MSNYYTELDEIRGMDAEIAGITCGRCGQNGFEWGTDYDKNGNEQSRLFDNMTGEMHTCPQPEETLSKDGIACKYCGEKELRWKQLNGKWMTHEKSGKIHACKRGNP